MTWNKNPGRGEGRGGCLISLFEIETPQAGFSHFKLRFGWVWEGKKKRKENGKKGRKKGEKRKERRRTKSKFRKKNPNHITKQKQTKTSFYLGFFTILKNVESKLRSDSARTLKPYALCAVALVVSLSHYGIHNGNVRYVHLSAWC